MRIFLNMAVAVRIGLIVVAGLVCFGSPSIGRTGTDRDLDGPRSTVHGPRSVVARPRSTIPSLAQREPNRRTPTKESATRRESTGENHREHGAGASHESAGGHELHLGTTGVSTDPSEFKSDLAIYTFVIFLLLLAVLKKFAWGPIAAGLDKREQRIKDEIAAAERRHEEARQMLADYERKLATAQEEVRGIIEEARRDAEYTAQTVLAKAKDDAQTEMNRAKREIETATAQALKELAETSANLAVELAGKVVRTNLSAADHARLIEEAMASFPQGDHRRN